MKRYKAPKGIASHPAVKECLSGDAEGFDYKHAVELKDGWVFEYGRMADCTNARFHTVADFIAAHPVRR